jgi:hypothetical protein
VLLSTHRLNRGVIAGSRDATTVEIPWDSRQALIQRLRTEGDADEIIDAFHAVGTTRPVTLSKEAMRRLLATRKRWLMAEAPRQCPR